MNDRRRITEDVVRRAAPGLAVRFLRDDQLIGFGLRVTPNGAKSFIVEGRVNGRMRRFTIGPAERFSVSEARPRARTLLAEMHDGKDPQVKRRAARERADTLATMLEAYILAKGVKDTTAEKYRAQMRRNLSDWMDKPIGEISPQMARLRYEAILKRSIAEANGTMRALRWQESGKHLIARQVGWTRTSCAHGGVLWKAFIAGTAGTRYKHFF